MGLPCVSNSAGIARFIRLRIEKMKIRCIALSLALLAAVTDGQEQNNLKEPPRVSRSLNYGNWVGKRVMTQEFMEQVGLQGEQAKKLKEALEALEVKQRKLDETINQAALQQAEIAKKVLSEPGASVDEVMKIIETIGKLRTEQAKLSTQMLVAIRDSLTAEQREKANAIIVAEGQKRMRERAARHEREERERNAKQPVRPAAPKGW